MTGGYGIGPGLQSVTDEAVAVVGCDASGLVLCAPGEDPEVVAASEGAVAGLEQTRAGGGPCLEALRSGQPVTCEDLAAESPWPDYCRQAADRQLAAVAAVPVVAGQQPLGALLLYWFDNHEPTGRELEAGRLLAGVVAGLIANLRPVVEEGADEEAWLGDRVAAAWEATRGQSDAPVRVGG